MRRKKLRGSARKIFRALDNDVSLKSKHARSGLTLRALIGLWTAETSAEAEITRSKFRGVQARPIEG